MENAHLITISEKSVTMMSDSGRKIDYSIRPAKCVERKIICEMLSRFSTSIPISQYRYIGFGSFYFSDFVLFHNNLNIESMISIEHSTNPERYCFNKPYNCITLCLEEAQTALSSTIDFSTGLRDIIWLDYDYELKMDIISDIITASQKVNEGSFIFVTFNGTLHFSEEDDRVAILKEEYGDYFSISDGENIDNDSKSNIFYSIIDSAIKTSLSKRIDSKLKATSFCYINYRDGAPMYTIGYYFHSNEKIETKEIEKLPGFTLSNSPICLKVPCFTRAEIREINKFLPGTKPEKIHEELPYLELADIQNYTGLYKYYPNYIDSPFYT